MENPVETIKEIMKMTQELRANYGVTRNGDVKETLLYAGVAQTDLIATLTSLVEKHFGKAYKPAGESALIKNWFDGFVRNVGGIRTDQTLFRRDVNPDLTLYCAFWPWGSEPVKTSIRIGLLCRSDELEKDMEIQLKGCF